MQVVHEVKCDSGSCGIIGNMGDDTIDNEGKKIMGNEANCDTKSHITDELHSQIKEEQGGKDQKGEGKKKGKKKKERKKRRRKKETSVCRSSTIQTKVPITRNTR
jgi:hypothetical protein